MNITVFEFQDYPVRFVGTSERPEWIAKDVCHCLGIVNVSDTLYKLDNTDKGIANVDTDTGKRQMLTVYEGGLYELIFVSRKPEAKAFKRWIIEEVLPSIRKTGCYSTNNYQNLEIEELEREVKRKKLILENAKLDQQLERLNKSKQADTDISDIRLAKIYRLLTRKGEITAVTVKQYIREFKDIPSTKIDELLLSLVELGKVQRIPTKRGVKIKAIKS